MILREIDHLLITLCAQSRSFAPTESMTFEDLKLNRSLRLALADLQIDTPTTIQEKAFAPLMAGKNVVGISQTGTGKTFAYLLPLLNLWKFDKRTLPQILILVPTRELVAQVVEAANSLCSYMSVNVVGVYGGANMKPQKTALAEGADVVVGTPGRVQDLILHGSIETKKLKRIVIDEVDEMLNQGFRTQLRNLVDHLPEKRQHAMFSATMTDEVDAVIKRFTSFYECIEAAPSGAPLENITQFAYSIANFNSKANLLEHLLRTDPAMEKVLIFAKTRKFADALFERMEPIFGEACGVIHSSKSQNFRFRIVDEFHQGTCKYLIATDIIARGLDVSDVSHVINFDLTDTPEKYIHRIGRTGRSERPGIAISLVSDEEQSFLTSIQELMDLQLERLDLPEEVELSEVLIPLEEPNEFVAYEEEPRAKSRIPSGPAFHEKSAKNSKVPGKKIRKADRMKLKYGKPKTRGQKPRGKKKR